MQITATNSPYRRRSMAMILRPFPDIRRKSAPPRERVWCQRLNSLLVKQVYTPASHRCADCHESGGAEVNIADLKANGICIVNSDSFKEGDLRKAK